MFVLYFVAPPKIRPIVIIAGLTSLFDVIDVIDLIDRFISYHIPTVGIGINILTFIRH